MGWFDPSACQSSARIENDSGMGSNTGQKPAAVFSRAGLVLFSGAAIHIGDPASDARGNSPRHWLRRNVLCRVYQAGQDLAARSIARRGIARLAEPDSNIAVALSSGKKVCIRCSRPLMENLLPYNALTKGVFYLSFMQLVDFFVTVLCLMVRICIIEVI